MYHRHYHLKTAALQIKVRNIITSIHEQQHLEMLFVGLTMATSAWKICLMNLFLEEWTSWMMSVWRLSRFFSRNPEEGKTKREVLKE